MLRALYVWLLIICLHTFNYSFSQAVPGKSNFDSIYYHIATTLSAQHIDEAISSARSLLSNSEDSLQKVRSLMLLATLHERTGRYTDALKFALDGEKLAEKINNKDWQIRISGFLSTTFRDLGLIAEGKKYIDVAESAVKNTDSPPRFRIFIHQEKAYYAIEEKDYPKALAETFSAMELAEKTPSQKGGNIILATCYQVAGYCYMNMDSLQQAERYLARSLSALEGEESELKGFIYQNLGALALKQNKPDEAIKHLEAALGYAATSENFNLKIYTYKSLNDYYSAKGDNKNAIKFQSEYTGLLESHSSLTKNVSNELIEKLGDELDRKAAKNYILYLICTLLLIGIIASVLFLTRARKKERKKYLAYIARLEMQNSMPAEGLLPVDNNGQSRPATELDKFQAAQEALGETPSSAPADKKEGPHIPKDTEERVLKDLSTLEQEGFYLKNDINLSFLSAALKVNSKYLSAIINRHKGKDFNNYINELRIKYVVRKLQTDPEYLTYKIAYLSQESGFSRHSKFTAAFKNVTGISPSAFISNLKKDARKLSF